MIDLTKELGHGIPQRIFNHRKSPACFVNGSWPLCSKIFGMPNLRYQFSDSTLNLLPRSVGECSAIKRRETITQRPVLVDQGSACDFGGVSCHHQIHVKVRDSPLDIFVFSLGLQHPKCFLQGRTR